MGFKTLGNPWMASLPLNEAGRDFVVGDIHGCLDELLSLLSAVRFNPQRDRLFSVGDLIDRGPKSLQCLQLLKKHWFFACRGNHEQMLIDWLMNPDHVELFHPTWVHAAGYRTLADLLPSLLALPHIIRVGDEKKRFHVLHAEAWDGERLIDDDSLEQMGTLDFSKASAKALWSRHMITSHWRQTGGKFHAPSLSKIFCGHTIVQLPFVMEKAVCLDTGAFAPLVDLNLANVEHFGLSLVEARSLNYWFAPTCEQYRGAVVDMGVIESQLN